MSNKGAAALTYLKMTGVQDILDRDDVTEISINQPGRIWFESRNGWEYVDTGKANFKDLMILAKTLSNFSELAIPLDEGNPICSVILPNGERGQIIIPPATENGCVVISIRKPSLTRFT